MLPSTRALRWLPLLSLTWIACSSQEAVAPPPAHATSTTGVSVGSTTGAGGDSGATSSTGGAGGLGGGSSSSASGAGGGPEGDVRLRVVAANLSSGNQQSYDPGDGIRILQGINADVVLMQEVNYGLDAVQDLRQLTDDICGTECTLTRGSGQIPNAIISRYPVLQSGVWPDPKVSNRDFTWARIDIPGATDLWAVSVHLLTSNATERNAEAQAIVKQLQVVVPQGDFLVMGGDFNTSSRNESALATLAARFSVAGPYPADGAGNENTNGPRTKPYDWVLASPELRALEMSVRIGEAHFDAGLVVDTRVYMPIGDLFPAKASDSDASNMQHMAVVRDFLLSGVPVTSGGI